MWGPGRQFISDKTRAISHEDRFEIVEIVRETLDSIKDELWNMSKNNFEKQKN